MTSLVTDSAELKAIRETVAAIATKYGPEYFLRAGRDEGTIEQMWAELGSAGLLGVSLPELYGGGGGGMTEAVVVVEELAAHGMPMLIWVISPAMCGSILARNGSTEMKREWLPGIAEGTKRMAFALTEPDAGSNTHQLKTRARKSGDGWTISGQKYYISAVDQCRALLVATRDAELSTPERSALSLFVVPIDAPGVLFERIDTSIISPDHQFTVYFDDVQVGPEALVGSVGNGLQQLFDGLNPERILVGAICSGIGRYALNKAAEYARNRRVWSEPIGAHQGVAHPLAECHIAVELGRLATYRSAELFDSGQPAGEAANIAKFAASEASLKTLDQAIQTHGGNGLSKEFGLSELWFVTRLMRTAPVSREMVLNFVAQTSLGLPKSY